MNPTHSADIPTSTVVANLDITDAGLTDSEKIDLLLLEVLALRADFEAVKVIVSEAGEKVGPFLESLRKAPIIGGFFK